LEVEVNKNKEYCDWNIISKQLILQGYHEVSADECKERWTILQNQHGIINKDPFSKQEEELIIRKHKETGNKWVEISKLLPGRYNTKHNILNRSDNQIKNYFYGLVRKEIRRLNSEFHKVNKYKSNLLRILI